MGPIEIYAYAVGGALLIGGACWLVRAWVSVLRGLR
jgi:hypothetical protein